jgi:hypothetical protein
MFAELYKKLMKAFVATLGAHIRTKTTNWPFHEASEPAYEALFNAAHAVAEKSEDMGQPVGSDTDIKVIANIAYTAVEGAMREIQVAISANKDPGMDNLLRSEYDKLQFQCGSLRGFCCIEDSVKKEEIPEEKPVAK